MYLKEIMEHFKPIITALQTEFALLTWRDIIEIIFFSTVIYYFTQWLGYDTKKNLVLPFYVYCGLLLGSYALGISGITTVLLWCAPLVATIFIVVHQTTLQKNFITLTAQNSQEPAQPTATWIEEVVRASLLAVNKNKNLIYIIERTQSLHNYIQASYTMHALCSAALINTVVEQSQHNPIQLWLTKSGTLMACNVQWSIGEDMLTLSNNVPQWLADALVATAKSDAVVLHCSSSTRLFTLVAGGKQITNLAPAHIPTLLHQIIKGDDHENQHYTQADTSISHHPEI